METEDGCDVAIFARAFAIILSESPEGFYNFNRSKALTMCKWPGLDIYSLRWELRDLGFDFTDEILSDALDAPYFRTQCIGDLIELTPIERRACRAWNLGLRSGETYRDRDMARRDRNNAQREAVRRDRGAVPRADYEANSLARNEPWRDLGISRATWFRRRKAGIVTVPKPTSDECASRRDTTEASTLLIEGVSAPVSTSKRRSVRTKLSIQERIGGKISTIYPKIFFLEGKTDPANDNLRKDTGSPRRETVREGGE